MVNKADSTAGAAAAGVTGAPQIGQKAAPAGTSLPHLMQKGKNTTKDKIARLT